MQTVKKRFSEFGLEIKPIGRIDINTAVEFGQNVNDNIDDYDIKELVLDLSEVDYVSSIGLRVLLELQKRMSQIGSMRLTNVRPEVIEIFKMTGFDKVVKIV